MTMILALDLYLRHRPHLPEKNSPQIQELSNILNQIGAALGVHGDPSFHNNSGVYMKLKIFHRLGTDYTTEGEVGLTRGGKDEEDVWQEFAQNLDHWYRVAQAIRAAIDQAEVLPVQTADEDTDDYVEAQEGRLLTALHRCRERSRKLVGRKQAAVL
jgi:5-methylcytosine-specific restriction protein A